MEFGRMLATGFRMRLRNHAAWLAFVVVLVGGVAEDASAQFRNNAFEIQVGHLGLGTTTDWANTFILGPSNEWGMSDQPLFGINYVRIGGDIPFTSWDDLWAWYPLLTFGGGIASPDGNTVQTGLRFVGTTTTGLGAKYYVLDEKIRPFLRTEVLAMITGPVDGTKIVPVTAGIAGYGGMRFGGGLEFFVAPEISIAGETSLLGLFTIFAPPKLAHSTRLSVNIYF